MHTKFWSENLKGRDISEDVGVYGKVILKRILEKYDGRCELDSSGSGCCEHGNGTSSSIRVREFLN
jgi:hypothetical protein